MGSGADEKFGKQKTKAKRAAMCAIGQIEKKQQKMNT